MFAAKPSSWLDRLRSNKGIPTTHDLNLDQFLLTQIPNSSQIPPQPNPNPNPPPPNQDPKWLNSISSALADLFVMGEEDEDRTNSPQFRKKTARKQPNPKIFIDRRREVVAEAEDKPAERAVEVKEAEEKLDLVGYSRSDLVIIDTSSGGGASWKTEKSVFRKGSVWKVREKKWKGRSVVVGRKKRKFSKVDDGSDDEKKRKKKRMKKKMKLKVGRIGKKGRGDENGGHPYQVSVENAKQVTNKEIQHNLKVSMKRCKYFMPPLKSAKRSSVFGTQRTPLIKENVVSP